MKIFNALITCCLVVTTVFNMEFTLITNQEELKFVPRESSLIKLRKKYSQLNQDELIDTIQQLELERKDLQEEITHINPKLNLLYLTALSTLTYKLEIADNVLLHKLWPEDTEEPKISVHRKKRKLSISNSRSSSSQFLSLSVHPE